MISFQFPMTLTLSKERKDLYVKNLKLLIKEKSTSFSECQSRGATMLGHCPLVKRSTLLVCSINLEWKDVSTPPEPGTKFHKRTDDKEQCDQSIYQLTLTLRMPHLCIKLWRPDVTAAVGIQTIQVWSK